MHHYSLSISFIYEKEQAFLHGTVAKSRQGNVVFFALGSPAEMMKLDGKEAAQWLQRLHQ